MIGGIDLGGAGLSGFNPATIAATLVSRNASRIVQAELSALKSKGQGKILSNPRIMTFDQVKAIIEQGKSFPTKPPAKMAANCNLGRQTYV